MGPTELFEDLDGGIFDEPDEDEVEALARGRRAASEAFADIAEKCLDAGPPGDGNRGSGHKAARGKAARGALGLLRRR